MGASSVSYKCASCGGELTWNAEKQLFSCEWCGSVFSESEIIGQTGGQAASPVPDAHTSQDMPADDDFSSETNVYTCQSCGAEIFCDRNTAASFCYYCHNPVTLGGRVSGIYRPEKILPFTMSREQAVEAFKAHCKKKLFLPSDFLSAGQMEKLTGLYVPFWVADCDVDASVDAECKKVHTHTHGDTVETVTHVYNAERAARMQYKGVPADGARNIEDTLMDAIEPYDYNLLRDFETAYLSGFYCDKYDVDKDEVFSRIKSRISDGIIQTLRDDITGYSSVVIRRDNVDFLGVKWHYMMLPVWFLTYKHKGKIYSFAMNGQTGKFAGVYPVSGIKRLIAGLLAGIGAAVIGYGLGGLFL